MMALWGNSPQGAGNGNDGGDRRDPRMRMTFGAIVAAYLIYLGYSLLKGYFAGEEGIPGWAAILFGAIFIIAGAGYILYQLKLYREFKAADEAEEALPPERPETGAEPENETLSGDSAQEEAPPDDTEDAETQTE